MRGWLKDTVSEDTLGEQAKRIRPLELRPRQRDRERKKSRGEGRIAGTG